MMDITLVIPSHNRHDKLARNLCYLNKERIKVIVVDSSINAFDADSFKNVEYYHKPKFNFSDKIIFSSSVVQTNYICLCADDDFVLVDKIEQLLLNLTRPVAGIIGSTLVFDEKFNGNFRYQSLINKREFFDKNNSNEFFSDYSQVLWGIYSTEIIKNIFSDIKALDFKNDNFIEIYLSYCLIMSGGIYRTTDYFSIREISPADHWGKRHKNIPQAYFEDIENTLSDFSNIIIKTSSSTFSSDFSAYIGSRRRNMSIFFLFFQKLYKTFLNNLPIHSKYKLKRTELESLKHVREALSWKMK